MKEEVRSLLMAGVGGQGILRASDILCEVMMEEGYDVKKSEVHGMAQRGGCVTSHVLFGRKVYSPLAKKGDVDIFLSFEKMETLRYLDYLKENGLVIINIEEIYPPSVNLGDVPYPQDVIHRVFDLFKTAVSVDAGDLANQAGNRRTSNTALLGVLSNYLDLDISSWEKVLKKSFPEKTVGVNLKAFRLGRKLFNDQ
ncbi:MAG: indolepyruvate oxidoreductase subunit beta [Syntrophales bacterium]|jgi:indolepyruvate ferredoxin oxidoreductase beta subunit